MQPPRCQTNPRAPLDLPIRDVLKLLTQRELSVSELLAEHVAVIERFNPDVNALVVPVLEEAMDAAQAANDRRDRDELPPLFGIPFTVKECFDVSGLRTTIGVQSLSAEPAVADSPLVRALRDAGAILIGKTNLPQLMWFNECDNPIFGRTSNPWDLARSPGGSSGGEAAILALGGSRLGFGTDSGGSIRVPAHFCGVHTLKPTDGRLTNRGTADARLLAGQEGIVDTPGPFARHVDDLALAMRVLAPSQPEIDSRLPPVPWREPTPAVIRGLRIGIYSGNIPLQPAPSVARVVQEAANALADLGAEIDEFVPPDPVHAKQFYDRIFGADGGAGLEQVLADSPRDWRIERILSSMRAAGRLSVDEYFSTLADRARYREQFVESMTRRRLDALLCPPFPFPAIPHGTSANDDLQLAEIACAVFNIVGLPAGVVAASTVYGSEETEDQPTPIAEPIVAGSTGLPVGVQVAARHWRDDVVLAVMAALEEHFRSRRGYPHCPRILLGPAASSGVPSAER